MEILSEYIPNNRAAKYVKQILIELKEMDKYTIMIVDINTPL